MRIYRVTFEFGYKYSDPHYDDIQTIESAWYKDEECAFRHIPGMLKLKDYLWEHTHDPQYFYTEGPHIETKEQECVLDEYMPIVDKINDIDITI